LGGGCPRPPNPQRKHEVAGADHQLVAMYWVSQNS
jgi:hypothetical protein